MGNFLTGLINKLGSMGAFRAKPVDQLTGDDDESGGHKLKRELGPIDAICMGVACIIGAGIFVMPGEVAATKAGPGIILSFLVSGLPCVFVTFCFMELTGMISKGGSAYTYSSATMRELVAWIIGFDLLLEYAIGGSAVAAGWSAYLQHFLEASYIDVDWLGLHIHGITLPEHLREAPKDMPWSYVLLAAGGSIFGGIGLSKFGLPLKSSGNLLGKLLSVALVGAGIFGAVMVITHLHSINLPAMLIITALSIMLMWGVKQTARITFIAVIIKLAVLALFLAVGVWHVQESNFSPFLPFGWQGVFAGAIPAFFAYIGFDAVSTLPEDCKNPKRDVPIGIGGSLIISTVLYMAVAAVMVGAAGIQQLDTAAPMAKVFEIIGVTWPIWMIGIGAIAGLTSVLIVMLLGQSRIMMSMSRDGLVPPAFSKLHPTLKTPVWSIFLLGIGVGLPAGLIPIGELVDLTSIGTLFAFLLVCVGVMVLRRTEPTRPRNFKVPFANSTKSVMFLGVRWYAGDIIPVLGVLSTGLLMAFVSAVTWERFLIWLAIGLVIYFTYSRFHSKLSWVGDFKPSDDSHKK
jgi:APA family basic amino acid/polyamine antiporter